MRRVLVPLRSHSPHQRKEPVCINITVCTVKKDQPSALDSLKETLLGMFYLFVCLVRFFFFCDLDGTRQCIPSWMNIQGKMLQKPVSFRMLLKTHLQGVRWFSGTICPYSLCGGSISPMFETSIWKRWVSQDFLEILFKIQQLLEHQ